MKQRLRDLVMMPVLSKAILCIAMCLLQIGELAGHLSEEYRNEHPQMPWRQIKALRNIIAHNYGSVDADTAWEIVHEDIPVLREYCDKETVVGA